jgi:GTPase SAR1 family protein
MILVLGTKIDLREDKEALSILSEQNMSPIRREQGQKLANKVRAVRYMECSALTQRGLKQVGFLMTDFTHCSQWFLLVFKTGLFQISPFFYLMKKIN